MTIELLRIGHGTAKHIGLLQSPADHGIVLGSTCKGCVLFFLSISVVGGGGDVLVPQC